MLLVPLAPGMSPDQAERHLHSFRPSQLYSNKLRRSNRISYATGLLKTAIRGDNPTFFLEAGGRGAERGEAPEIEL